MSQLTRSFLTRWALVALVCLVSVGSLSGAGATARPEEVGLSADRLQQVNALVKRHLDAKSFAGAGDPGRAQRPHRAPAGAWPDGPRVEEADEDRLDVPHHVDDQAGRRRRDPDDDRGGQGAPHRSGLEVHPRAEGAAGGGGAAGAGPPPAAGTQAEPRFYTVPADHEITVEELLTHTSGLVERHRQQRRQPQGRPEGRRVARRLHPAARADAARVSARHALGLQRAGRLRRPAAHRRDRLGPAGRRVPQDSASSTRSA